MAPAAVTNKKVLEIRTRMNDRSRMRVGSVKFNVGQHVRKKSKEKMKFAKGSEQNYTDDIFRIVKVIRRTPRPLYELEDLKGTLIEGQFHGEGITLVRITTSSVYKR